MVYYIKKLELRNFKIHKNLKINFSKEKNLIIGENGTGKSSIFHAMVFSLFGNNARSYIGISELSSLIRHLNAEASIKLTISDGNKEYTIEREIRRGYPGDARIKIGQTNVITSGIDLTNKKILNLFKLKKPERYLDILYIPQGKLEEFVNLSGKKEFAEKIEEIFDIKIYSLMIDVIRKLINELNSMFIEKKKELFEKEREFRRFEELYGGKTIEELENLIKKKRSLEEEYLKLKEIKTKIDTLKSSIDYDLIKNKNKFEEELNEIREKLKVIENKLTNLYSERKNLTYKTEGIEKYVNRLLNELEEIKSKLEEKVKDLNETELKFEYKKLQDLLATINKFENIKGVSEDYEAAKHLLDQNKNIKVEIEKEIRDLKDTLDLLSKRQFDKCPICNKPLTEEEQEKIKYDKENRLKELKSKLYQINNKIFELERNLKELEYKVREFEYLKRKLDENDIDVTHLDLEKSKISEKLAEIKVKLDEIKEYEEITNAINYLKDKEINNAIRELEHTKNSLKDEERKRMFLLNKIKVMEENIQKINDLLVSIGLESEEDLLDKLKVLDERLKDFKDLNEREIELYKKYKEDLEKLRKKVSNIREKIDLLTKLKVVLERFVREYRKAIAKALSTNISIWFRKLYKYQDITDIKLELEESPHGYKFVIYVLKNIDDKNMWISLSDAGLSGGQRKVLDLAIRLALAELVNPELKVLLLDEPTESLDENVRINLAEILENLKEYQIILCTHDDLFKEKMSGNVIEFRRS